MSSVASDGGRTTMTRPDHVYRVQVTHLDGAVEMGIDEVQAGRGAPVAEEARLYMLLLERLAQQGVVEQVNLANAKVIGRAPPAINLRELVFGQRPMLDSSFGDNHPRRVELPR